jgi:iron complex outermembrane receptor protein
MKIRIGVRLAAHFTFISLLPAQQAPAVHETVVVTGYSEPTPLDEADRNVTSIALPRTERSLYDSWFSLLQLDPSLSLLQRSPGGFIGDLSIRGASYGQTLVLLDGMRINDAQTGHFHLDAPLPLEAITSIEVLKGSGSTLYGSDAIGGVVNIRTRTFETPEFRILAGGGSYGANQQHASASTGGELWSEELDFARDFTRGFQANRDYRNLAISSLTGFRIKPGSGSVLLAYSDRPFGADQFYGAYPSWERAKTWFGSLHQHLGNKTEIGLAYRRHTDLFVLYRYSPQIYTNRHLLNSWQGNLRRHDNLPGHAILSYGAEGLSEAIQSTNLGVRNRKRGSGYVFYDLRALRRFSLSAGIREEIYGSGLVATSPSLSGAAWLNSRMKLRASVSRAFRLPTYTDLYYSDPANRGNPNLKHETATNYEAGLDAYIHEGIRAAVTVFHRRDRNVIDYVRATPADLWQATNFDQLNFTGVEASGEFQPRRGQTVRLGFTGLHGVRAGQDVLLSKYTFNYPVQSGVAEWRGMLGGTIAARARIGAVSRLNRSPYAVWDTSATWAKGRVRPFGQIANITSTRYQEIPGVALPGRTVMGGIEFVIR